MMGDKESLRTDLPIEVVNALEAARRVSYAFHGKQTRAAYEGRWDEFLPQHESLIALDAWLTRVDERADGPTAKEVTHTQTGSFTRPKGKPVSQKIVVQTLLDVLGAFPAALSRLPADVQVHKAQRAVTVLEDSLRKLLD